MNSMRPGWSTGRRKASWARLNQKVYEVDPLECVNCGATMRVIALIDDTGVIERILKHLDAWDPQPDTLTPAGPGDRTQRPCSVPGALTTR